MSPAVVIATRITRSFGVTVALDGVDLAAASSDVVLLAGPNGAGKSTLLRILAGLSRPTGGTVQVLQHDLRRDPASRSAVGYLSHQTMLYDDLTVRENLRFAATLHRIADADDAVQRALDSAALASRAQLRAGALSHGLKQRLAIARATLHAPQLLLLDEPFSGLDVASADLLRETIATHSARGAAVICVSHQPLDLWQVMTRVVVLHRGRVVVDAARPDSLDALTLQLRSAATVAA